MKRLVTHVMQGLFKRMEELWQEYGRTSRSANMSSSAPRRDDPRLRADEGNSILTPTHYCPARQHEYWWNHTESETRRGVLVTSAGYANLEENARRRGATRLELMKLRSHRAGQAGGQAVTTTMDGRRPI